MITQSVLLCYISISLSLFPFPLSLQFLKDFTPSGSRNVSPAPEDGEVKKKKKKKLKVL